MAGDARTGVTIHRTTPELDAGPIAAQEAFELGPDDDAGAVFDRSAEIAARLLDGVIAEPQFEPQPEEGVTYAEKITPEDRELDLSRPAPELVEPDPRALAAHRRARRRRRPPASSSGRRAPATTARSSCSRCSPKAEAADGLRRVPARPSLMAVSAARRVAYEVLLRVFEQDAYADRVFRTAARDLDERERAFAQRLSYGAVQRVRTLDYAIDTLGKRPVRKLDPPVRAALRLGAYQLGYTDTAPHAAANESVELVRRARLERAVPFTNAVMRRLTEGIRPLLDSLPDGALKESYPDWIAETFERDLGARRRARADARDERAARDGRSTRARRPAARRRADRHPRRVPRRARGRSRRRGRPDLAAEPRLAARGPRRRLAGRRARARSLLGAGRQDEPAARRRHRGRARPEPRQRAAREPRHARRGERDRRRGRRDEAAARAPGLRPCPRRRALLRARRPRAAARSALARRRRFPSSSSRSCARPPSG